MTQNFPEALAGECPGRLGQRIGHGGAERARLRRLLLLN